METKHTPTPWSRNISPDWKYPIYASATGNKDAKDWIYIAAVLPANPNNEADLDFIIKAVNCHEELLNALKLALATIERLTNTESSIASVQGTYSVANKAIAKAEGK